VAARRNKLVVVVSRDGDLHAGAVMQALRTQGVEALSVDFASLSRDVALTLHAGSHPWADIRLSDGRRYSLGPDSTIWWRRPKIPVPSVALPEDTVTFVRAEWEHFLQSVEACVLGTWVNSPSASVRAANKAHQLVAAASLGLTIPKTAFSNDGKAVREIVREGKPLVYKRLSEVSDPVVATLELRPEDLGRLDQLCNCPAIFQELVNARSDIRITAIGDDLLAAEIDSQSGASKLDWRFDHSVSFRAHQIDDDTKTRLRALMRHLGLRYGAIDMRLTPQGEYVFLEVNPAGQFLFVELLSGIKLVDRMADYLAQAGPNFA
jgi:glutathione synthase/RimK-type ligase-like ATP-grasp enzyme